MELVNIKDLSKTFKGKRVLHDINFTIEKGEIYGLVGNNGAGKTTLLRMICNLLQPTSGRIEFNKEAFSSKIKVGTLIEHPALYFDMTAYENIKAKVLVLDEPINGLDPQGITEVRNLLVKIHNEHNVTMIISSHILDELAKTATRFCVISKGRIIKNCTKEQFMEECGDKPIDEFYLQIIQNS